jgi:hypothetical protein
VLCWLNSNIIILILASSAVVVAEMADYAFCSNPRPTQLICATVGQTSSMVRTSSGSQDPAA